jgi:hypothetical protein
MRGKQIVGLESKEIVNRATEARNERPSLRRQLDGDRSAPARRPLLRRLTDGALLDDAEHAAPSCPASSLLQQRSTLDLNGYDDRRRNARRRPSASSAAPRRASRHPLLPNCRPPTALLGERLGALLPPPAKRGPPRTLSRSVVPAVSPAPSLPNVSLPTADVPRRRRREAPRTLARATTTTRARRRSPHSGRTPANQRGGPSPMRRRTSSRSPGP